MRKELLAPFYRRAHSWVSVRVSDLLQVTHLVSKKSRTWIQVFWLRVYWTSHPPTAKPLAIQTPTQPKQNQHIPTNLETCSPAFLWVIKVEFLSLTAEPIPSKKYAVSFICCMINGRTCHLLYLEPFSKGVGRIVSLLREHTDSGIRWALVQVQFCHFPAMWPWKHYLASLDLNFLVC